MLTFAAGTAADHALFAAHTGYIVDPKQFNSIVAVSDGKTIGVIGFDYWTPGSVQVHIWIGNPAALRGGKWLHEVFKYAFVTCGKKVVFGVTPSDNLKAVKFNRHAGMKEVTRLKDAWDTGIDMVITEMRPDWCRWLEERYNGRT